MDTNTATLTFQDVALKPLSRAGQTWLRMSEIEQALGYAMKGRALAQIYKSHADEFTASMTRVVKLATAGGKQAIRIFSLRGAHLLAMFARTDVAKAFRVWVLNILDAEVAKPARQQVKSYHFPLSAVEPHDREKAFGNAELLPTVLLDPRNRAPEMELIEALERDGHDVTGARLRIIGWKRALEAAERGRRRMANWEVRLTALRDEVQNYQREEGLSILFSRAPDPANQFDRICFPHQLQEVAA